MKHNFENLNVYVATMGKLLKVTAIFDSDDEANEYMARTNDAVVAVSRGGMILLANKYDRGVKFVHYD